MRAALIAIFLCIGVALSGEAAELRIGPVSVSLGQDQVSVMKSLNAEFSTTALDPNDLVLVIGKDQPNPPIIGGVMFVGGRVVLVQRLWGDFEGPTPAIEISKAMFAAIESATAASGQIGKITTESKHVTLAEIQTLTVTFSGRRVQVTTTFGDASVAKQVRVSEEIFIDGK